VFEYRRWLQVSLICTSVLATGLETAFSETRRERHLEVIKEIKEVVYGSELLTFLGVFSLYYKELAILALGAAVTIGGVLLAGKSATKTGTVQVEKKKLLVRGAAAFMVCVAGLLIILFAFMKAYLTYNHSKGIM